MSPTRGQSQDHDSPEQGKESQPSPSSSVGRLIQFPGLIPYDEAWVFQKQVQEDRQAGRQEDTLMLLEHQPVYTLGRSTHATHWTCGEEILRRTGASLQSVDRGGSITYHGPGQVVGYPILKLSKYCSGPKQYVRMLEEVLIHTLARWGIEGYRVERKPGVWVRWQHADAKIAAIGVRIDHGITIHGFALNVDLDLFPFSHIMPCGLTDCHITSMAEIRQSSVSLSLVAQRLAQEFAHTFHIEWETIPPNGMRQEHHPNTLGETTLTQI